MNGVLFINKPAGWTSRDVVNKIMKIYQTKKVGHTGTLDPMATGVLIVCLGSYTKLVDELTSQDKTYEAGMKIGIQTDTGDITGNIIKETKNITTLEQIESAFFHFPKEYLQTVPIYSAVKINGKKLYEYAREGLSVELPKRFVRVSKLDLLSVNDADITFSTVVSKGTYIRSLIEDIAKNMDTVATMTKLVRTRQGNYRLEDCFSMDDITIDTPLKKIEDLFDYQRYILNEEEYNKVLNGNSLILNSSEQRLFLSYQDMIIAIYEKNDHEYKMIFRDIFTA